MPSSPEFGQRVFRSKEEAEKVAANTLKRSLGLRKNGDGVLESLVINGDNKNVRVRFEQGLLITERAEPIEVVNYLLQRRSSGGHSVDTLERHGLSTTSIIEIQKEAEILWKEKIAAKVKEFGGEIPPIPQNFPKFNGSPAAQFTLEFRYLLRDENKNIVETPEERFWAVGVNIARAERRWGKSEEEINNVVAPKFATLMTEQKFMANTPTIANAGKENGLQGAACFVLPVEDSMAGIFDALKRMAIIHQSGGGTGFFFGSLRPKGDLVSSTKGESSGPVSFMEIFDAATDKIKQGGIRRGANMGILNVNHPDIIDFITCKSELDEDNLQIFDQLAPYLTDYGKEVLKTTLLSNQIANFNISISVTEEFMKAVGEDGEISLTNPRTKQIWRWTEDQEKRYKRFGIEVKAGEEAVIRARMIWDFWAKGAWRKGDPGMIVIDRINQSRSNPVPELETIEATNPCGEQPLAPNDACNLGSINLGKYVKRNGHGPEIDWQELAEDIPWMIRFLDDMVEENPYPTPETEEEVRNNRRIGFGVMGWHDMLMLLGIRYDSEEAVQLSERVMGFIQETADQASIDLAKERGPFPNFPRSRYKDGPPIRNATRTTIAPTGSISIFTDCSSGIEPLFGFAYRHTTVGNIYNRTFEEIAKREGFYAEDLTTIIAEKNGGSVKGLEQIPAKWQEFFNNAREIATEWHVRHQAAFQRYTDNGVSKTINMSFESTVADVANAYLLAYKEGCNGITIYRDGSAGEQPLRTGKEVKKKTFERLTKPLREKLPDVRQSVTHKFQVGPQEGYLTVGNYEDGRPGETFLEISKEGSTVSGFAKAVMLLTSLALQYGVPLEDITRKMKNTRFEPYGRTNNPDIPDATSVLDYIFHWLELRYIPEAQRANGKNVNNPNHEQPQELEVKGEISGIGCPDCGTLLIHQEGCLACRSCGFNKCG